MRIFIVGLLFLCSQAFASDCGFRAHRAEVDQTAFTPNTYSQVFYPSVAPDALYNAAGFDIEGRFVNSLWVPVPVGGTARMVGFGGQLWIPNGQGFNAAGQYYVARIVKNGYPAGISIGAAIATKGAFSNDWVITLSMHDYAQPGDSYGVYFFSNVAGTIINGISLHTWWDGACL